jgi:hypothetical protein
MPLFRTSNQAMAMSHLSVVANVNGHEVTFEFDMPTVLTDEMQELQDFMAWQFENSAVPARTTTDAAAFNTACPRLTYAKKVKTGNDDDTSCAVCCTDFKPRMHVRRLPCGHLFCSKCITKWVTKESATCPTCRESLT